MLIVEGDDRMFRRERLNCLVESRAEPKARYRIARIRGNVAASDGRERSLSFRSRLDVCPNLERFLWNG